MLTRNDLLSPNRQDRNAGNSGDLLKHISYLALLRELGRAPSHHRRVHIVEAHAGKGVYAATHPHLFAARQLGGYSESTLGSAQAACLAPEPGGIGHVAGLQPGEIAYAGSSALHAFAVAQGLSAALTVFDSDPGVRDTATRVFSAPCFAAVRPQFDIQDPAGQSEPELLSRLQAGSFGNVHVLHFDPFAFVMAQTDASIRATYRDIVRQCDARVGRGELAAASVFFTWGPHGAAATDDLFGTGYLGGQSGGYQDLVSIVNPERRVVVKWCWQLFFALLFIVPSDIRSTFGTAIEADSMWLAPRLGCFEVIS
jgi:hypothetical protein